MAARRINLLPPELLAKRRSRQTVAVLGAAGIALIVILGLVYGAQEVRLRVERNALQEQEDRNAVLRAEVAELRDFEELENRLETKLELAGDLSADEVRWSVILADISLVIPDEVWLESLTGSLTAAGEDDDEGDEEAGGLPTGLGLIAMNGKTLSHPDVARWLTRLEDVDEFLAPYLTLSSRTTAIAGVPIVDFSSSVRLSQDALRVNQRGAGRDL